MATQEQLTEWIRSKAKSGSLAIREYSWTKELLPEFTDIQVSLKSFGFCTVGRSLSLSPDLALVKAAVESLERLAAISNGLRSSNGVAGHFHSQQAKQHSIAELIERDRFLSHLLACVPFFECSLIDDEKRGFENYTQQFQRRGVRFFLRELRQLNQFRTFVVVADGSQARRPFGVVVGLGCSMRKRIAIESAYLECLRHLPELVLDKQNAFSEEQFSARSSFGPSEHHELRIDIEYAAKFMSYVEHSLPEKYNSPESLKLDCITSSPLEVRLDGFTKEMAFFASSSEELVKLQFGPFSTFRSRKGVIFPDLVEHAVAQRLVAHPLS